MKTFDVVASRFMFEPAVLSVYEGERVRLRVRSADGIHGIAIKAFRVKAWIPAGGEIVNVEFLAGQPGTFDIVCSEYCGSRHGAMKGRLIVLARKTGTG